MGGGVHVRKGTIGAFIADAKNLPFNPGHQSTTK